MARAKKYTVVLVGPHAGKSIELAGFKFVDGKLELEGTDGQLEPALSLLANFNSAYVEGSEEYRAAQAAWDEAHPAPKAPEASAPSADEGKGGKAPAGGKAAAK